jgi:hypothetical protein
MSLSLEACLVGTRQIKALGQLLREVYLFVRDGRISSTSPEYTQFRDMIKKEIGIALPAQARDLFIANREVCCDMCDRVTLMESAISGLKGKPAMVSPSGAHATALGRLAAALALSKDIIASCVMPDLGQGEAGRAKEKIWIAQKYAQQKVATRDGA